VQFDDGTISAQVGGGANSVDTANTVSDNLWHHVAVVYDQSAVGLIQVYIDGLPDNGNANTAAWAWPAGQQIELGHSHDSSWESYNGLLDDVRIYNRVLTAPEIALIKTSGSVVDATALQVRLNFDTRPAPGISVSWLATGATLQSADVVTGPYTDITPTATSPYYVAAQSTAKFYRYRRTAVSINSNPYDM
jgi:Concanavalin A-like lectin/glucanases superfamily